MADWLASNHAARAHRDHINDTAHKAVQEARKAEQQAEAQALATADGCVVTGHITYGDDGVLRGWMRGALP